MATEGIQVMLFNLMGDWKFTNRNPSHTAEMFGGRTSWKSIILKTEFVW